MTYFISINKNTYLLLYLGLAWLLALTYNFNFNSNSKYNFYAKNDADFLRPFNGYMNESLLAITQMNEWLNVNNIQKPLFNRKYLDQSKNTLCVGIITKKRLDKRFPTTTTLPISGI